MKKIKLFNVLLSTGEYKDLVKDIVQKAQQKRSAYACLVNVHMLNEAKRNISFQHELDNASMLLPDGMPLSWALKLLYGVKQSRIPGMDLLPDLIAEAARQKTPVFFYGGTEETLSATKELLKEKYPQLPLAGFYSPPFRQMSDAEELDVVNMINNSGAQLVFVALGCPKQETWMGHMRGHVNAYMVGIGGALNVLIGNQKRAPVWMQHHGFEWLYRLTQEPARLFKRYAVTNSWFMYLLLTNYIRIKFLKRAF